MSCWISCWWFRIGRASSQCRAGAIRSILDNGWPELSRAKRSLALREFALGVEALERFVRKEPLRRVHECVFGVLELESEPVDPRL